MSDGQAEKTFIIEKGQAGKTFKIESAQTAKEPRKTFRVEDELILVQLPDTNREIMLARQLNAYDCGPCIVLNTLQVLGVNSELSQVDDVRSHVNRKRTEINQQSLSSDEWLTNIDVDEALRAQGLDVKSWPADEEQSRRSLNGYIGELTNTGQEFVIYSGSGRHYKGFYMNEENKVFELDSLKRDVPRANADAIQAMITRVAQSDRAESISVASRTTRT